MAEVNTSIHLSNTMSV